jgi:hypothetical protein
MRDVLEALLPRIKSATSPMKWFTKRDGRGSLNEARSGTSPITPPYGIVLAVSSPHPDRLWQSLLGLELHAWGSLAQVSEIQRKLQWLDGDLAGDGPGGEALKIEVRQWGNGSITEEPELRAPDGDTLYHLRMPYRAHYGSKTKLDSLRGVSA